MTYKDMLGEFVSLVSFIFNYLTDNFFYLFVAIMVGIGCIAVSFILRWLLA